MLQQNRSYLLKISMALLASFSLFLSNYLFASSDKKEELTDKQKEAIRMISQNEIDRSEVKLLQDKDYLSGKDKDFIIEHLFQSDSNGNAIKRIHYLATDNNNPYLKKMYLLNVTSENPEIRLACLQGLKIVDAETAKTLATIYLKEKHGGVLMIAVAYLFDKCDDEATWKSLQLCYKRTKGKQEYYGANIYFEKNKIEDAFKKKISP